VVAEGTRRVSQVQVASVRSNGYDVRKNRVKLKLAWESQHPGKGEISELRGDVDRAVGLGVL
jgi:hypothetical protein